MKHLLAKIISFFKGHSLIKYILLLCVYLIGFSVAIVHLTNDVQSNVVGTVVGLVVSGVFLYFAKICLSYVEDISKVTDDNQKLKSIYPDPKYCKTVELNGSKCEVIYNEVLDGDNYDFEVVDSPEKKYEAPSFVDGNFLELLKAHESSYIKNNETIRLDDVERVEDKCTFYLSRSNYFNHLATNRAVDFSVGGTSLRGILEYGPELSSLKDSKFSNHIGVNALVFLSDGAILVPRRKNDATISKNMITSSIATRLALPKWKEGEERKISKRYLFNDNILNSLTDRLKIPQEEVKKLNLQIKFIGVGQNVYEGGKPQMYFAVKILNLDSQSYYKLQKNFSQSGKIDIDKCTYFVDYKSMKFVKKDKISFSYTNPKTGKIKNIALGYEKSFACNVWHFERNEFKNKIL